MSYGDYLRNKYHHAAVKIADAEGVPCVLEYSKGKNIRNYEIYGNSVQDGTPSPESPVEIQSVGDLTVKNLLPYPYYDTTKTINGITFTDNGDGTIAASGTATSNTQLRLMNWTTFDKTKKYYISGSPSGGGWNTHCIYISFWLNGTWKKELLEKGNGLLLDLPNMTVEFNQIQINCAVWNGATVENITFKPQLELGSTATEYEPYHKYDVPITVTGKNLLPNSDWMSGEHATGFTEQTNVDYITEYTQNSISFNLAAWKGVSSPRFKKGSVKRIVFKINQNQINSDDGYINFYIVIQGYDDNNNKVGNQTIYNNAVADTEYIFDFSTIASYNWYANSTQFSFCILARKNALSNLMVYDIAYYAEKDTAVYEPYKGSQTTHIYLDEPLRKVGDYADYIDFKNQKVVRQIKYIRLEPNLNYNIWTYNDVFYGFYVSLTKSIKECMVLSNYFKPVTDNKLPSNKDNSIYLRDVLYIGTADWTTVDDFKAWLSDNIAYVAYVLKTPTEETIALPALKTFKGTSIISADTTVLPSNIKVKYVRT